MSSAIMYHNGHASAIAEPSYTGETAWNDNALLAFARATCGPTPGSADSRLNDFLDRIGDLTVRELVDQFGHGARARKLCAPIADITINAVLSHLVDRLAAEIARELDR